MPRRRSSIVLVMLLLTSLTGCGSADDGSRGDTATRSVPAPATTPAPAPTPGRIDERYARGLAAAFARWKRDVPPASRAANTARSVAEARKGYRMIAATFTHHARDLLHLVPPAALRALHREAIRAGEAAARVHRRLADEMHGSRTRMRRIGDRYFQPLTDAGEAWVRTVEALTAAAVR